MIFFKRYISESYYSELLGVPLNNKREIEDYFLHLEGIVRNYFKGTEYFESLKEFGISQDDLKRIKFIFSIGFLNLLQEIIDEEEYKEFQEYKSIIREFLLKVKNNLKEGKVI